MNPIGQLLCEMLDQLPLSDADSEDAVFVHDLHLKLPIETRIRQDGTLLATAPRGRLATGFDPQIGMLSINFERGDR